MNEVMKEYAATNPKTRFVDVGAEFVDAEQKMVIERLIPDGINPNDAAWHVIARLYLDPFLEEFLGKPAQK
jgi:hypothetical protein